MLKVYVRLFGDMAIILFCECCCGRAALAAAVDVTTHHAHISDLYMGVIVAVSVVLYTSLHMDTLRVSVLIWNY